MPSPHEYGRSSRPADDPQDPGRRPGASGESRPYRSADGYSYDPASYGGSVYRPAPGAGPREAPTPPYAPPDPGTGRPAHSPYGPPARHPGPPGPGGPPAPSRTASGPGGAGGPGAAGGPAAPPATPVPGPRPASTPDARRRDPDRAAPYGAPRGTVGASAADSGPRTRHSSPPPSDRPAAPERRRGAGRPVGRDDAFGEDAFEDDAEGDVVEDEARDRDDVDDDVDDDVEDGDDDAADGADSADSADGGRRGRAGTRSGSRRGRGPKGKRKGSFWRELPLLLLVAFVLTFAIQTFVARIYVIPSQSMEQTLIGCTGCTNDRVAVDKVTYRLSDPSPGDVVVFAGPPAWRENDEGDAEEPSSNVLVRGFEDLGSLVGLGSSGEKDFVKRVIAVGGQTVACCDAQHRVTVDGRPLAESYLYFQPGTPATQEAFAPVQVPAGQLWVMGDNRNNSADSRYHGPIGVSDVIGKARFVVLPVSRWTTVPAIDPQTAPAALGAPAAGGPALGGTAILVALPLAGRLPGRRGVRRPGRAGRVRRRGPRA